MNIEEIEILIEKYFDGETSLDEEHMLRAYFNRDDVPVHLIEYRNLFGYFNHKKEQRLSKSVNDRIIENISKDGNQPFYTNKRFWFYFTGIAASILFVLTILLETQNIVIIPNNLFESSEYTRQDAELAYLQTKVALGYVSSKYAQGVNPLGEIIRLGAGMATVSEMSKFDEKLNSVTSQVAKMDGGVDQLSRLSKISIFIKP
nr:hypothetical protein [Bacteroidota bacterium]